jgi:hypothetical protein
MSEQDDRITQIEETRALALIQWVFEWVFWRVNKDYDAAAGHDQAVVGILAYKYAVDLFDRLASSGRYRLPQGEPAARGADVLRDGIPVEAYDAMLGLDRSIIQRHDFFGSPGWVVTDIRWILQSITYGEIDKINWNDKSDTKQRVGRQPYDFGNPGLFELDEYGLEPDIMPEFAGVTFVLAHGFNGETGSYEVYFGRSRAADQEGTGPWHWRKLIASGGFGPTDLPRSLGPQLPGTPPEPVVPDAMVRIRETADGTDG